MTTTQRWQVQILDSGSSEIVAVLGPYKSQEWADECGQREVARRGGMLYGYRVIDVWVSEEAKV